MKIRKTLIIICITLLSINTQAAQLSQNALELSKQYGVSEKLMNQANLAQDQIDHENNIDSKITYRTVLICGGASAAFLMGGFGMKCFNFSGQSFTVSGSFYVGLLFAGDAGIIYMNSVKKFEHNRTWIFAGLTAGVTLLYGGSVAGLHEIADYDDDEIGAVGEAGTGGWIASASFSLGLQGKLGATTVFITAD